MKHRRDTGCVEAAIYTKNDRSAKESNRQQAENGALR